MIGTIATGLIPITAAALGAAVLMALTGCVTMDEGYRAIDWKTLVLIGGMIPMAVALERVGLVDTGAGYLADSLGIYGPRVVLAGLFLLTALFTQILSNTATTVVIAPVALTIAQSMNVEPHAFLMAVAVAASMGFASPLATPSNTLVMAAGNYRFGDYARIGIPLIILSFLASVLMLPFLFPF